MRSIYFKNALCITFLIVYSAIAQGQQADSIRSRELSDVEVVGKANTSVTRTSAPIQLLSVQSIERLGLQDLSDAIKRFSGVTVKDYGGIGGLKTVSIRSFGAQHTAVSYDGIAITDAQSGQVDISRFSLDNVEQLALTIGQSDDIFQTARMFASAGAISIRTNTPAFVAKNYNLRAKVAGGSFGYFNPSVQYEQKLNKNIAFTGRADWMSAKGEYPFTLTNGQLITKEKRKNSDIQSLRMEANMYANFKSGGLLTAKVYYYDSERGLPGSVILYNDYAKERLWDNNMFAQMHFKTAFNKQLSFQTSARYSYTYSKYRNIDVMLPDGKQEDRNTQQEYYLSGGVLYQPVSHLSASLTTDIAHSDLSNNYVNAAMPKRLTSLTALALQYQNSRLTVTGSLLGTYITEKVKSGTKPNDRKRLSPSFGFSLRPFEESNFRIRASFKDIFRVPTFTDMYYQRLGNTDLKPERALQYNVGLTWSGRSALFKYLSASVDAYYNKAEDKIVAIPTMHLWKMRNLGEVETKGVDMNLQVEKELTNQMGLLLSASYSYQHAIDVTDPESKIYKHQIQYAPEHSGNGSLSFENPWINIGYTITLVGKRYALPQNNKSNEIAGYAEQNISLNRTFPLKNVRLRVQGEILNLTDKTYDIIRFYPMPGRSWRLSMTLIF